MASVDDRFDEQALTDLVLIDVLVRGAWRRRRRALMPYNPCMPIYEYTCAGCGERFEIICGHAERDDKAVCPACGGRDVAQAFGGFTVGISRTRLNPGVFERKKGKAPEYKPPAGG